MTEKFYAIFFFFFAKFKGTNCNSELVARLTSIAIKQNYAPKGTSTYGAALKSRKVNSVITHNRSTVQKFKNISAAEIFQIQNLKCL